MNNNDSVLNDETLFRAVLGDKEAELYTYENGNLKIRSKAFLDPNDEPSVGRAKLVGDDPVLFLALAELDEKSGVVSLKACVVREIKLDFHTVDIVPDPTPNNPAHAKIIIHAKPKVTLSGRKKRSELSQLRHALANIATDSVAENGWALSPKTDAS